MAVGAWDDCCALAAVRVVGVAASILPGVALLLSSTSLVAKLRKNSNTNYLVK